MCQLTDNAARCRFFDIAVPRNLASDINDVPSSRVFNVDDLKEVVAANKEGRRQAAAEAEVLLRQEQLSFEAWRDSLETVPTIKVRPTCSEIGLAVCILGCIPG